MFLFGSGEVRQRASVVVQRGLLPLRRSAPRISKTGGRRLGLRGKCRRVQREQLQISIIQRAQCQRQRRPCPTHLRPTRCALASQLLFSPRGFAHRRPCPVRRLNQTVRKESLRVLLVFQLSLGEGGLRGAGPQAQPFSSRSGKRPRDAGWLLPH